MEHMHTQHTQNIQHTYNIYECPHCQDKILIYQNELNCRIFRHGVYKQNMQQIPPHLDKTRCDQLFENGLIYGCGKPFRITEHSIEICDYI